MVKMPPKRSSEGDSKPRKRRKQPPKDTELYKERRDRNNISVRKSRDKSKQKAKDTIERVARLRIENQELEQQVEILSKELVVLKDLFKSVHAGGMDDHCPVSAASQTDATVPGSPVNISAMEKDHEYSKVSS